MRVQLPPSPTVTLCSPSGGSQPPHDFRGHVQAGDPFTTRSPDSPPALDLCVHVNVPRSPPDVASLDVPPHRPVTPSTGSLPGPGHLSCPLPSLASQTQFPLRRLLGISGPCPAPGCHHPPSSGDRLSHRVTASPLSRIALGTRSAHSTPPTRQPRPTPAEHPEASRLLLRTLGAPGPAPSAPAPSPPPPALCPRSPRTSLRRHAPLSFPSWLHPGACGPLHAAPLLEPPSVALAGRQGPRCPTGPGAAVPLPGSLSWVGVSSFLPSRLTDLPRGDTAAPCRRSRWPLGPLPRAAPSTCWGWGWGSARFPTS